MTSDDASITGLLDRIDTAWTSFGASHAGLNDEHLLMPGVTGDWSVRDILAHVAVWDTYSLDTLPGILRSGEHPDYGATGETIDAFNARTTEERRGLSLEEVRQDLDTCHRRLLDYLQSVPPEQVASNAAFRERLGGDTWDHYPEHAAAIRAWRERQGLPG